MALPRSHLLASRSISKAAILLSTPPTLWDVETGAPGTAHASAEVLGGGPAALGRQFESRSP